LDTTVLVGAALEGDERHEESKTILSEVATGRLGTALVSELVIAEAVTILGRRPPVGPAGASAFLARVVQSPRIRCLYLDQGSILDCLALYPRFKAVLSFTDVSNVILMLRAGCNEIYSHDADFDRVPGIIRKERP
jgi:predicted nucleic acid-binding protein